MNSSTGVGLGVENKVQKAKPVASKVVTRADAKARRVLSDIGNLAGRPAKANGADATKEAKPQKQTLVADRPMPRKSGVILKNKISTTRASSLTSNTKENKDGQGNTRTLLLGNHKSVQGRALRTSNVENMRKTSSSSSIQNRPVASALGKQTKSSNVDMSGKGNSNIAKFRVVPSKANIVSNRIERAVQASIAGVQASIAGVSENHQSGSGKPPRVSNVDVPRKRSSSLGISGKPPRSSNVNMSAKGASGTVKLRVCPPKAKVVTSKSEASNSSKRKGKLQRAFTSTLAARSEAAFGHIQPGRIEEGDLPNIDEADTDNQLAVVDYVHDIYHFYWEMEARKCASSSYMSNQVDISQKMRGILVDWLIDVHMKFELMPETLFLMANLIDRFLSLHIITRKDFQLVGLTALLVSAKYEEIWPPKVDDLVEISRNSYTHEQVLCMEKLMLNKLRFNLTVPTPYVFMKRFLKAAQADSKLEMLSFYLVELCLVEYETLKWKPSMLAASAIFIAQHILQRMPPWTRLLQKHARYTESELMECATMIARFHKKAEKNDLKVVYDKYSRPDFQGVAKLPYATSLLQGV